MKKDTHSSPGLSTDEDVVGKQAEEEGDIGFDTTDTELDEGTEDLSAGDFVGGAVASALDQHACKTISIVRTCRDQSTHCRSRE